MRALGGVLLLTAAMLVWASPGRSAGPGGWSAVGGGLNDTVFALNTDQPGKLIVGGRFTDAGGVAGADGIAVWDGTTWSALGTGLTTGADFVSAIAVKGDTVYAAGTFPGHVKKWNGSAWVPTCGGDPGGPIDVLLLDGDTLYIGGAFQNAAGNPNADSLLKCNTTTDIASSAPDGPDDLVGRVKALAVTGPDSLYVGGEFIDVEGDPRNDYIVRYDGSHFKNVGQGQQPGTSPISTANVDALATDGTNVFVGADDDSIADDASLAHLAKWTGFGWTYVGIQVGVFPEPTRINAIKPVGGDVYVTGSFANGLMGNPLADHVLRFDGTKWNPLGSNADGTNGPFIGEGYALATFNGQLILGGGFVDAGGDTNADRLAAYPLPAAPTPTPSATPTATATPTAVPTITPAAQVELTDTPKKKIATKRRRVTVTYRFRGRNVVSFACKLDSGAFKACTSPKRFKVGRGRHTVAIAGVNADGVRGKSAEHGFRVVRKRKG